MYSYKTLTQEEIKEMAKYLRRWFGRDATTKELEYYFINKLPKKYE